MLNRLQKIKHHREQSLRRALAQLLLEEQNLLSQKSTLIDKRNALFIKWREQADESGFLKQPELALLRSALARTEQNVLQIKQELDTLKNDFANLSLRRQELEAQLARNLREQEKLSLLDELK